MMRNWREYLIEAVGLGMFMISASVFGVVLFHPQVGMVGWIPAVGIRRMLMGLAMACTSLALVYSRWGQRSGAHFNPALTFTFFRLGKIDSRDAAAYIAAQFVGGLLGMTVAESLLGDWIGHPSVGHVATLPGRWGWGLAWVAEFGIAGILMWVVLAVSNSRSHAQWTGLCAAGCVFLFISLESPVSGMSLNPARSVASAYFAGGWESIWIYLTAPVAGMWVAAEWFGRRAQLGPVACAKLHHHNEQRCLFCEYQSRRRKNEAVRNSPPVPLTCA